MQRVRKATGMTLLIWGAIGCLLPIVPGLPFLLAGTALLGSDHPMVKPWVRRLDQLRLLKRKKNKVFPNHSTKTKSYGG